jgi:hypothetical protein
MKQYLLTSRINDKILYKKKITSDTVTYEYYSDKKDANYSKQHCIPYAKQLGIAMLFLMLFLVN